MYYGDGLVVREIGKVPAAEPTFEAEMNRAVQAGEDSEMAQRLGQAALVVSGTASSEPARFVSAPAGGGRITEHDPDYYSVTVTVETVEKGVASPGQTYRSCFQIARILRGIGRPR